MMNFLISGEENVNELFVSEEEKKRCVAEQQYKREVDWKEAGEERGDERAGILTDNISGTRDSEELLVISAIYYIINRELLIFIIKLL